ncbi:MAG: hypothetical protein ACF8PN_05800 [Phycisphaerales bacterium]
MVQTPASWHSKSKRHYYHNNTSCDEGMADYLRDGSIGDGGLPLCPRCAELNRRQAETDRLGGPTRSAPQHE